MLKALMLKYEAEIESAKANITVYLDNPVGIGEHPDLVAAVDSQVEIIAHAQDKIEVLKRYYGAHVSKHEMIDYRDIGNDMRI